MRLTKNAGVLAVLLALVALSHARADEEAPPRPGAEKPWEKRQREAQDVLGGVPARVLALQSLEKVKVPALEDAIRRALEAAREAMLPLIDRECHKGRRIVVPDDFPTIQAAIDEAQAGETVVVKAGTYYELLTAKDGVKLVSDASDGGNEMVAVKGAHLELPKRALRTIIDGSKAKPSRHGMIDFEPGTTRHTVVDGFTIQHLPTQDHHVPGHAHGLNIRGASPIVMNCLIRDNGSTGIGNHVTYVDQAEPIPQRDFRWANIRHRASAVLYHNIVRGSLGRGIGCNHFATPFILGNEVHGNADDEGGEPGPGIGMKHGAAPIVIGNLVYSNPGGGIMTKVGAPQGKHPIDRRPHPSIEHNVVFDNGSVNAAISAAGCGTIDQPVRIVGNWVYGSGTVGIGLRQGAVALVEANLVLKTKQPGIAIRASTVLKLNGNRVTEAGGAGFAIVARSKVLEMRGNAADRTTGPRFVLADSAIEVSDK